MKRMSRDHPVSMVLKKLSMHARKVKSTAGERRVYGELAESVVVRCKKGRAQIGPNVGKHDYLATMP